MTLDDLKILGDRMSYGPVPTQAKKVYAYLGPVRELLQMLPGTITIRGSVLDACAAGQLPSQEETIPRFIQAQLTTYIENRRRERKMSIFLLDDAEIMARYRLPATFLYSLVGDIHAIILCIAQGSKLQSWKPPTYVRFDPDEITHFFERTLGDQCIHQIGMGG
jgi:hypothetical protein